MATSIYKFMGGINMINILSNKQWDEINSRYNEHITSYIIFIMDKLEEHLTIKEVFDIIDATMSKEQKQVYNRIIELKKTH